MAKARRDWFELIRVVELSRRGLPNYPRFPFVVGDEVAVGMKRRGVVTAIEGGDVWVDGEKVPFGPTNLTLAGMGESGELIRRRMWAGEIDATKPYPTDQTYPDSFSDDELLAIYRESVEVERERLLKG